MMKDQSQQQQLTGRAEESQVGGWKQTDSDHQRAAEQSF